MLLKTWRPSWEENLSETHLKQGGFIRKKKAFPINFVISESREEEAACRLPTQFAHSLAWVPHLRQHLPFLYRPCGWPEMTLSPVCLANCRAATNGGWQEAPGPRLSSLHWIPSLPDPGECKVSIGFGVMRVPHLELGLSDSKAVVLPQSSRVRARWRGSPARWF